MNGSNEDEKPSDDRYISKMQLAQRMEVTTRTIENWMRENKVPFEKIGRTVRFHWGDVRTHFSRQTRVAEQPPDQLRPVEGIAARLQKLAASIRNQKRLKAHKAKTMLGNNDDNSTAAVVRAKSGQSEIARGSATDG